MNWDLIRETTKMFEVMYFEKINVNFGQIYFNPVMHVIPEAKKLTN